MSTPTRSSHCETSAIQQLYSPNVVSPQYIHRIRVRPVCIHPATGQRFRTNDGLCVLFVPSFPFRLSILIIYLVTFSGRGRKRKLRSHLRNARSWDEWKTAAGVLDEYLGFNDWKKVRNAQLEEAIVPMSTNHFTTLGRRRPVL